MVAPSQAALISNAVNAAINSLQERGCGEIWPKVGTGGFTTYRPRGGGTCARVTIWVQQWSGIITIERYPWFIFKSSDFIVGRPNKPHEKPVA